jgi:DNA-binding NtrC family response regulator
MNVENKILIVENNKQTLKLLENGLNFCGYLNLEILSNTKELQFYIEKSDFQVDILFLSEKFFELSLKNVNGLELITKLKQVNPDLVIVIIAHCFMYEFCEKAFSQNFDYFFPELPSEDDIIFFIKKIYLILEERKKIRIYM